MLWELLLGDKGNPHLGKWIDFLREHHRRAINKVRRGDPTRTLGCKPSGSTTCVHSKVFGGHMLNRHVGCDFASRDAHEGCEIRAPMP